MCLFGLSTKDIQIWIDALLKAVLFVIIEYIELSQHRDKLKGMFHRLRTY